MMTATEVTKANIEFSKLLGWKFISKATIQVPKHFPGSNTGYGYDTHVEDMGFHTSWDWLLKVYELLRAVSWQEQTALSGIVNDYYVVMTGHLLKLEFDDLYIVMYRFAKSVNEKLLIPNQND